MRLPLPGSGRSLAALAAGRVHARVAGRRALGSPPQRKRNRRPYVIGSVYPVTGALSGDGEEMVLGSALAVTELNARGGIAGRPVEQIVVDVDPLDPSQRGDRARVAGRLRGGRRHLGLARSRARGDGHRRALRRTVFEHVHLRVRGDARA